MLHQLEAFVAVARHGTARAAAEALHLSQPALSARIAALETALGARLFERTKAGMTLTPAGRAYLPHAERALAAAEAGAAIVRDVEAGDEGELVLGAAPAPSGYVVPELIARLRRRYPGVHVTVRTGRSRAILDLVARGEAQLGLVHDLPDERVVAEPLYEEELSLVARPDHPFAYEGWVTLERLREATLVLFDPSSTYYERTDALLRAAGVVPHSRIEVDNIEVACRLVARGIGVALLPTTSTAESIAAGALSAIGLAGVEPIRGRVVLVERPGAPDWEPLAHLRRLARAIPESIPGARPVSDAAARPGPRRAAARRAPPPGSGPGSRRPARTR